MKNAILVAALFVVIAAVSCKKDDETPVTSIDLLTSATWKIDTIAFDLDKNGVIDNPVTGGLRGCELDNTLTFMKDSTGVFDEGTVKCDDGDPQTIDFTWQMKGDTALVISGNLPGELNGDVKILTLNNSDLIMAKNLVSSFPIAYDLNLIVAMKK